MTCFDGLYQKKLHSGTKDQYFMWGKGGGGGIVGQTEHHSMRSDDLLCLQHGSLLLLLASVDVAQLSEH